MRKIKGSFNWTRAHSHRFLHLQRRCHVFSRLAKRGNLFCRRCNRISLRNQIVPKRNTVQTAKTCFCHTLRNCSFVCFVYLCHAQDKYFFGSQKRKFWNLLDDFYIALTKKQSLVEFCLDTRANLSSTIFFFIFRKLH